MDTLKNASSAIALHLNPSLRSNPESAEMINLQKIPAVREAKLLATGGYNAIWLVKLRESVVISKHLSTDEVIYCRT